MTLTIVIVVIVSIVYAVAKWKMGLSPAVGWSDVFLKRKP